MASSRYLAGLQNLFGRAISAGDGSMDCAVMAGEIARFSGEKQRVKQRRGEFALRIEAPDSDVAVGSSRVRIRLPVVGKGLHQF